MQQDHLPAPIARIAMSLVPPIVLQPMVEVLMQRMRQIHPRLFKNLARLDAAVVRIEPSDLPHKFILTFGKGRVSLVLADDASAPCDACVKGKLEALLDLLEGRTDSDMLFFSRGIEITGDTSVMVGLRNTLDREEINLLDDVATLCGPFALPARRAIMLASQAAERIKNRLADIY